MKKLYRLLPFLTILVVNFWACEKLEMPNTAPSNDGENSTEKNTLPIIVPNDSNTQPASDKDKTIDDTISFVLNHGTDKNPYVVSDFKTSIPAMLNYYGANGLERDNYVLGYIVGYIKGTTMSKAVFKADGVETNIVLADSPDELDYRNCLPVQLSKSSKYTERTREALNLHSHPENFKKRVLVYGKVHTYMHTLGITNTKGFIFIP